MDPDRVESGMTDTENKPDPTLHEPILHIGKSKENGYNYQKIVSS